MKTDSQLAVIYIFIDGIGIGLKNPDENPFSRYESNFFSILGGETSFRPPGNFKDIDAQMGVPGLPQSATGQTALFTGYNGPQLVNRHVNGYPTFTLRPYLLDKSILKRLNQNNMKATLINAYSEWYLNKLMKTKRKERMMSASTTIQHGTGLEFKNMDDLRKGQAIYMDITHWYLRKMGFDIELRDPKKVGRNLVKIARNYDLVLYEYFLTDKAGHSGKWGFAKKNIQNLDAFLSGVWEELNPSRELVIISSDHGNMENLAVSTHTKNKVPLITYGKFEKEISEKSEYLYDIPRKLYNIFQISIPDF